MNTSRELHILGSADDLAREAAARIIDLGTQAITERGRFSLVLSGGSTPRRLYQLLTQPPYRQSLDWSKVHLFFADERYVPFDDPDSTVRLVRETLLAGIPIPAEQFHPMPTQDPDPEVSALAYEKTLQLFFEGQPYAFDLVLLGMGPDGHTASLFPGFKDSPLSVFAVQHSPKPPPTRLTLSLDTLRQARSILFMVTGADKALILKALFHQDTQSPTALPAARVHDREGQSVWLVDLEAGSYLHDFIAEDAS